MLQDLLNTFDAHEKEIEAWLNKKRSEVNMPVYTSCDIRNAGYKLTTVDTNLFPAGWNNLCPSFQKIASNHFKEYFENLHKGAECILIVTEEHTRNSFYFSNVKALVHILEGAGYKVYVGNPNIELTETTTFDTADNETLTVHPIERRGDEIYAKDHRVCMILFNNDFSNGIPDMLKDIVQPKVPNLELGWHNRRKSTHFNYYNGLVDEFASIINFDAWSLKTEFDVVEKVDINDESDRERLAKCVGQLIDKIASEYKIRNIEKDPVVFVKNDAGTYGMGVISVKSGDEIRDLNRKNRNKLSVGKSSVPIVNFIIQEGVPTIDKIKNETAEPVVYLAGGKVCGGFFRVNDSKGDNENLNSPGMKFVKLCFERVLGYENDSAQDCDIECLDRLYRVVGQIASIAAGLEDGQ
jgi:glutamate--cysteine ligase